MRSSQAISSAGTTTDGDPAREFFTTSRLRVGIERNSASRLCLGYRGYFAIADSRWKTFFDLDLAQHVVLHFAVQNDGTQVYTIGPRISVGVQLDFLPIAGVNLMLEGELGFGDGLRFSGGLTLGFQLRSYLLE